MYKHPLLKSLLVNAGVKDESYPAPKPPEDIWESIPPLDFKSTPNSFDDMMNKITKPKRPPPKEMHVDNFIEQGLRFYDSNEPHEAYARWVLHHMRLPATMMIDFSDIMKEHKLFCTYEGKRYRVVGGSRMGDIWLTPNFEKQHGYEHRVDPMQVSNWGKEP